MLELAELESQSSQLALGPESRMVVGGQARSEISIIQADVCVDHELGQYCSALERILCGPGGDRWISAIIDGDYFVRGLMDKIRLLVGETISQQVAVSEMDRIFEDSRVWKQSWKPEHDLIEVRSDRHAPLCSDTFFNLERHQTCTLSREVKEYLF